MLQRFEAERLERDGMTPTASLSIVHVVPSVDAEASGPSYSVPRLCEAFGTMGHDVKLLTVGAGAALAGVFPHRRYPISRLFGRFYASPALRSALFEAARDADILHGHSLWLMPNVYPAAAARRWGKPLVMSPRGTLSAVSLSRSRWQKRAFWTLLQGPAVRSAACLHATSEQEYRDIRRAGLRQPVAVVPNGVDVPQTVERKPSAGQRTLLYLGRLAPDQRAR